MAISEGVPLALYVIPSTFIDQAKEPLLLLRAWNDPRLYELEVPMSCSRQF